MAEARAPAACARAVRVVHVFEARNLSLPPKVLSCAHVSLYLGACTAHTHSARVRPERAVRWDASVALADDETETARSLTVCVLASGPDGPRLLGQVTVPNTCVFPRCCRVSSSHSLTPRTGRGARPTRASGTRCATGRPVAPVVRLWCSLTPSAELFSELCVLSPPAGALRLAVLPLSAGDPARLPPPALLRGAGQLVDDGCSGSPVADALGLLRGLVPLPEEPVTWTLTAGALVLLRAERQAEAEARELAGACEGAPRLTLPLKHVAAWEPCGDGQLSALPAPEGFPRAALLRVSGGPEERDRLARRARRATRRLQGTQHHRHAHARAELASVAVCDARSGRVRLIAQAPGLAQSVHLGPLHAHALLRFTVATPSGVTELQVTLEELMAASCTPGRVASARGEAANLSYACCTNNRAAMRTGWALLLFALALAALPGCSPALIDPAVACLLLLSARSLLWRARARAWSVQVLRVRARRPKAHAHASSSGSEVESDAASEGGDDEALATCELLPDGREHPLWSRYRYVWGDGGKEGPPASSLETAGRLPHALARLRMRACLRWRREVHMDEFLERPQPYFHLFKRLYPHCFHGLSRAGDVVFIEQAGCVRALARGLAATGATPTQAALHIGVIMEFLGTVLDPRPLPGGRAVRLVDVAGISFGDLASSEVRLLLRAAAALLSPYFPERVEALVMINAPPSFTLLWALVSPMVSRRTLARITVVEAGNTRKRDEVLQRLVAPDQLPVAYGGTCACAGEGGCMRQHPLERRLWKAVEKVTTPETRAQGGTD